MAPRLLRSPSSTATVLSCNESRYYASRHCPAKTDLSRVPHPAAGVTAEAGQCGSPTARPPCRVSRAVPLLGGKAVGAGRGAVVEEAFPA